MNHGPTAHLSSQLDTFALYPRCLPRLLPKLGQSQSDISFISDVFLGFLFPLPTKQGQALPLNHMYGSEANKSSANKSPASGLALQVTFYFIAKVIFQSENLTISYLKPFSAPHYLQSPGKQLWVTIQALHSPHDLASPLSCLTSNLASSLNLPCRSPSHGSAHAFLLVECPSSPPSLWKNSVLFLKKI